MAINSAIALAVAVVFVASIAQVLLKLGISSATAGTPLSFTNIPAVLQVVLTPMVFMALFLYGVTAMMWIVILAKLPLSTAYPILGLTFVFVPLLAALFLRESISPLQVTGTILIAAGVVLVNR